MKPKTDKIPLGSFRVVEFHGVIYVQMRRAWPVTPLFGGCNDYWGSPCFNGGSKTFASLEEADAWIAEERRGPTELRIYEPSASSEYAGIVLTGKA